MDGIWTYTQTALVKFDVPIDPSSVTSDNLSLWGRNYDDYTDTDFHPIEGVVTKWNTDHTAVTLTFSWNDGSGSWDFERHIGSGIQNAAGVPVDLGEFQGQSYLSWDGAMSFYVDAAASTPSSDTAPTLVVQFNTDYLNLFVDADAAGNAANYQLADPNDPNFLPTVTGATAHPTRVTG